MQLILCFPRDAHAGIDKDMSQEFEALVITIAERARAASLRLAAIPGERRNAALERLATLLCSSAETILEANVKDLAAAKDNGLSSSQIDRLTLTPARLAQLGEGVRQVAALPDPVGELLERTVRPNGLELRKVRVPIGVIGIIYEARPNVTIDCAILTLKSGNAAILRGGKESFHTNMALAALIQQALADTDIPSDSVQLIPTTDRTALNVLLKLDHLVHALIPRGGEGLIRFVSENSRIPVIKHYNGVCSIYVDKDADLAMAERVLVNAKCQRPGVCNAAEQLIVHTDIAETALPRLAKALIDAKNVQLRCDEGSKTILDKAGLPCVLASEKDFRTEFLDYIMAIRLTPSLEDAIASINQNSSGHSEAILTRNAQAAKAFFTSIDSSAVFWNASTRFNDGFEFGLGAEIGISTDRLHARGPVGLKELCSYKWLVTGNGQIRS